MYKNIRIFSGKLKNNELISLLTPTVTLICSYKDTSLQIISSGDVTRICNKSFTSN